MSIYDRNRLAVGIEYSAPIVGRSALDYLFRFNPKQALQVRLPRGTKGILSGILLGAGQPSPEALTFLTSFYKLLRQSPETKDEQRCQTISYRQWARLLDWPEGQVRKVIRGLEDSGVLAAKKSYDREQCRTSKTYSFPSDIYQELAAKDGKLRVPDPYEGLLARLERSGVRVTEQDCIVLEHEQPYPRKWYRGKFRSLSRIIAKQQLGEIEGKHVHHTCHNPACFAPEHLEIRTGQEHLLHHGRSRWGRGSHQRSKTRCPAGHPYSGKDSRGYRICHNCRREQARRLRCRLRTGPASP